MASGLLEQPAISVGAVVGADQWKVRWMKTVIEKCVIWNYAHGSYLEIESLEKGLGPDEGKADLERHRETAGLAQ